MDHVGGSKDDCPFNGISQLADVARPMVCVEHVPHLAGEWLELLVHLPGKPREEMFRQQGHVPVSIAQRGHPQLDDVQSMVQVLPKIAGLDGVNNVPIGRRENPDVHPLLLCPTDPDERAVLEKTQQLGLQGTGHLADFVEKQGSAVGLLHLPGLLFHRAGERTFLVPKQFTLEQCLGNCRAVKAHVGLFAALAGVVDGSRD